MKCRWQRRFLERKPKACIVKLFVCRSSRQREGASLSHGLYIGMIVGEEDFSVFGA